MLCRLVTTLIRAGYFLLFGKLHRLWTRTNEENMDKLKKFDLTRQVEKDGETYFALGTSADFWKGKWIKENGIAISVAVKVIRSLPHGQDERYKRMKFKVIREASILCKLNHPHITPFYGISFDFGRPDSPCLVYPFYESGDLMSYLQANPQADRLRLICQVASGLAYLHGMNPPVVHGDIKGSNILVNDSGHACLADFGLGRLTEVQGFTTNHVGGTCRWMAYELIYDDGEEPVKHTTQSDVWAFGMTVLEILTGKAPFSHLSYDASVIFYIVRGRKPRQPEEIQDKVWSILCQCWAQDPRERPTMSITAFYLDFMFTRTPSPEECKRLLGLLAVEDGLDVATDKIPRGSVHPVIYCNWPSCSQTFTTLENCQEHEEQHWDLLLSP
ncbi:hypothetical protein APHAL10511_004751 [Amanita phalloides]|nr:hypothetical protein APHAL10511_004751 [Amanita phalloides]